ncbi:DUF2510 domain-containing protein, partial [Streptomyces sp. NPDC091371]|uniref:DUF2510 domain-containing protein n=1 Tax=Streptomyces sp. NPDC091371 TaxID=3155303 RepID=UPI003422F347
MAREGYYPDPSIPGFVRYWNGLSWVPGTSRPAEPAAWQADPVHQEGFGGPRDRRVSWGSEPNPDRPGISLVRPQEPAGGTGDDRFRRGRAGGGASPQDGEHIPAPASPAEEDRFRRGRVGGGASPQDGGHDAAPGPADAEEDRFRRGRVGGGASPQDAELGHPRPSDPW